MDSGRCVCDPCFRYVLYIHLSPAWALTAACSIGESLATLNVEELALVAANRASRATSAWNTTARWTACHAATAPGLLTRVYPAASAQKVLAALVATSTSAMMTAMVEANVCCSSATSDQVVSASTAIFKAAIVTRVWTSGAVPTALSGSIQFRLVATLTL